MLGLHEDVNVRESLLESGSLGRNRNDKLVFFEHVEDQKGSMVNVRIDKTSAWSLQGTPVW